MPLLLFSAYSYGFHEIRGGAEKNLRAAPLYCQGTPLLGRLLSALPPLLRAFSIQIGIVAATRKG